MPLPTQNVWHQSPYQTIYRFENGYGASVVQIPNEAGLRFAPLKFTTNPERPFFIHYSTPLGQPRTGVTESNLPSLLGEVQSLSDDAVDEYSKQMRARAGIPEYTSGEILSGKKEPK